MARQCGKEREKEREREDGRNTQRYVTFLQHASSPGRPLIETWKRVIRTTREEIVESDAVVRERYTASAFRFSRQGLQATRQPAANLLIGKKGYQDIVSIAIFTFPSPPPPPFFVPKLAPRQINVSDLTFRSRDAGTI